MLGPVVKAGGFSVLLGMMAGIAGCTAAAVAWLPRERTETRVVESRTA
jgi:hypothetical protein